MKKKKTLIILIAAFVIAGVGFASGMLAKEAIAGGSGDIGIDRAKEIALASVGVSAEKATFTKAEQDLNAYEIDFYTESNEYDFEIDADTGAIVEREVSPRDLTVPDDSTQAGNDNGGAAATEPAAEPEPSQKPAAQEPTQAAEPEPATQPASHDNDNSVIGVDAAKQIVLNHAGISSASFLQAHLDYDDGIRVYDLEFNAGGKNYEYEINAITGSILDYDVEHIEYDDDDDDDDDD